LKTNQLSNGQYLFALACLVLIFAAAHDSKARFAFAVPLVLLGILFVYQRFIRPAG
jgi:hypothetical protein